MAKQTKKILITGGAGYIGQNLISYLLKEKYKIEVNQKTLDRMKNYFK